MFLLWPVILTHIIDKDSPLYDIRPPDLSSEKFELILYLTGTVESTGNVLDLFSLQVMFKIC